MVNIKMGGCSFYAEQAQCLGITWYHTFQKKKKKTFMMKRMFPGNNMNSLTSKFASHLTRFEKCPVFF